MNQQPTFRQCPWFATWLACAAVLFAVGPTRPALAQPASDVLVQDRTYVFQGTGKAIPYSLFVPSHYDSGRHWPLIVALHGYGASYRGMLTDYEGMLAFAEAGGYIVVSPLGYDSRAGFGGLGAGIWSGIEQTKGQESLPENLGELSERDVMNVLGIVRREFNVDEDRIYLWGHSMGGTGAFHLAARYPSLWGAVAVAAPGNNTSIEDVDKIAHIPTLVLKGDQDERVPVSKARALVARMKELGMEHLYIEVKGGDHAQFILHNRELLAKVFAFFDIVRKDQRSFLK